MKGYLYTDGACRGNGRKDSESGAGAILYDKNNKILARVSEYLGKGKTNNIAEYEALIFGLEEAINKGITDISIFIDSKLICNQVEGIYKVHNKNLKELIQCVDELLEEFDEWNIKHIHRKHNKEADKLANKGIDNK